MWSGQKVKRMLKKILIGLIATFGSLLALVVLQPSEYRVTRKLTMAAPAPEIFAQINDFHRWEAWSPWAKRDPAAKATFDGPSEGKGAIFSWSGNSQVGEGKMTLTESRPSDLIRTRTDFVKPFVGTSFTEFTLVPEGNGTTVTWMLFGQNDFIGKAMCLVVSMDKVLGGEMEKGLAGIKALVEAPAKTPTQK